MTMAKVSLMVTCLGDALFPDVGTATVLLLHRLGVEVDFPTAQTCCGQPHFNSGYPRTRPARLARHAIRTFAASGKGGDAVRFIHSHGEAGVSGIVPRRPRVGASSERPGTARTRELWDFLVNVLGVEDVGAARRPGDLSHGLPPLRSRPTDGGRSGCCERQGS